MFKSFPITHTQILKWRSLLVKYIPLLVPTEHIYTSMHLSTNLCNTLTVYLDYSEDLSRERHLKHDESTLRKTVKVRKRWGDSWWSEQCHTLLFRSLLGRVIFVSLLFFQRLGTLITWRLMRDADRIHFLSAYVIPIASFAVKSASHFLAWKSEWWYTKPFPKSNRIKQLL